MRSLRNKTWPAGLFLVLVALIVTPLKADDGFFTVDVEVANFEQGQLDSYFARATETLLVRLTGNPDVVMHPVARQLISQARASVRNYQLVNRQIEGVVLGQDVRVEFNSTRVINQLQQAEIPIWPQVQRPQILVVGDWLQRGLRAEFSQEGFGFRPDLDFRPYPNAIGLSQHYLANLMAYRANNLVPVPAKLSEEQIRDLQREFESKSHLLTLSAQVVGDIVQVRGQFYELESGDLLWEQVALGEAFHELVYEVFERVLREESARYYATLDLVTELWVEVDEIPNAELLTEFERVLVGNRLIFEQVRLIQIDGRAASFAVRYRGDARTAIRAIEMAVPLTLMVDDLALGYVRYQYNYSN
ncbi:DUF2066 domain-containing protein [Thiomicrospira cyclica]|uniref:DUF2066 domain-containing protein n=1 Tax=Thiomicrospira cyclica (strain DSM 14477 / JCM 11371 / ALM1) TaxID=717773 RepID=F6DBY0_THICA|nr:DUF2066 domain-containing protein [Thiomicrospira cyclica]AEG31366.1 Protein of unknown function DUF2066 [Thiomicrospira cyclica ALM1]